ncbi:small acid-soluble spore protein H [Paenibacillus sp.]|uniref:small acid-soluble spore protein H n=1 Tax=Paenibacillus sp. TaxID=58172 RepID=UPI002D3770AE|nr:small acid-soluble spore protein H [Paenibacillus sp.]HZG87877.1 small acid-soluble spore protein H [Paenibacillus sp.]
MNRQRAQEIADSPVMANVTYEGVPIYIQHVDHANETARVFPLDDRQNEYEVPVSMLQEH